MRSLPPFPFSETPQKGIPFPSSSFPSNSLGTMFPIPLFEKEGNPLKKDSLLSFLFAFWYVSTYNIRIRGNQIVYLGIPQGFLKDYCLVGLTPGSTKHKQQGSLYYSTATPPPAPPRCGPAEGAISTWAIDLSALAPAQSSSVSSSQAINSPTILCAHKWPWK